MEKKDAFSNYCHICQRSRRDLTLFQLFAAERMHPFVFARSAAVNGKLLRSTFTRATSTYVACSQNIFIIRWRWLHEMVI